MDSNERVILFVKLKEGHQLDERLKSTITKCIRTDLSPRHVPAFVFQAPDIPVTINGKKTEVPVKKIVSGLKTTISSTIVNPESLEWYQQFAALDHNGKLSRQSKL